MVVHLPSVGRHLCDGVTAHLDPTVTDTHHPGLVSTLSSDRSIQDPLYPLTLQRLNLQVAPTLTKKKTPKEPTLLFFSLYKYSPFHHHAVGLVLPVPFGKVRTWAEHLADRDRGDTFSEGPDLVD